MRRVRRTAVAFAAAAAGAAAGPELVGHAATPLFAGCTHVFLDLGANAGVQTRKLHEPKLYAGSSFVPLFRQAGFYEPGAVRCAVGVEPSRMYWPRLRELAARYTARNMRTTFVLGGVGVANATACFEGGSKTGRFSGAADAAGQCKPNKVATPVWDVANLLRRHVPGLLRAVVAKVDVEGMEYKLFRRILEAGVDCAVTEYAVERHGPNHPANRARRKAWERLHRPNNESSCALSHRFDDESYRLDPWPLPSNGAADDSDWANKSMQEHGRFWLGKGRR